MAKYKPYLERPDTRITVIEDILVEYARLLVREGESKSSIAVLDTVQARQYKLLKLHKKVLEDHEITYLVIVEWKYARIANTILMITVWDDDSTEWSEVFFDLDNPSSRILYSMGAWTLVKDILSTVFQMQLRDLERDYV